MAFDEQGNEVAYVVTMNFEDSVARSTASPKEVGCLVSVRYQDGTHWENTVLADNEIEAVRNAFLGVAALMGGAYKFNSGF